MNKKRHPVFWWDFLPDGSGVVVQSDWSGGERLAVFKKELGEDCETQIAQANKLIADYDAGRKTPPWRLVSKKSRSH